MADTTDGAGSTAPPKRGLLESLELDLRLLGMIGAFAVICIAFQIMTGGLIEGRFLTPRNIFTLTIQTVSVAIMATGMVFVIVTRHIDLSVGSVLATCSAVMAMTQTQYIPEGLGLGLGHPVTPWLAIAVGLVAGTLIGALHGWLVGYLTIPAFIVTLGGLLVWRNVGWFTTNGQTIGPLDETFASFGGTAGTLGEAMSWILGAIGVAAALWALWSQRRSKIAHGFAVKPIWAECVVGGIIAVGILGFVAILNSYTLPPGVVQRELESLGCTEVETCIVGYGLPISVLVLIAVGIGMTVIAQRTRFGRYVFAAGGNPDAAKLSGIDTRWLTVKIFALMGFLCALSAVVASARQTFH
ncbi:MAG: sugar ABC transporter permease, partial [Pseudomonadota bacterium]